MDRAPTSSDTACSLLAEGQAAEMLNVSVRTLQDWRIRSDGPPFVRLGRLVRYDRDRLAAWLERPQVPSVPSAPVLPAFTLRAGGDAVHVVAWCPWCEDLHWHGAAGGPGNRGAHCAADRHSPLQRTGYTLGPFRDVATAAGGNPPGLMVGRRQLHRVMDQASGAFRAVALRFMLGLGVVRGQIVEKRTRDGRVWIFGADTWLVEENRRPAVEGTGFIRLAATLFGVPPGVAAVRFLEAVSLDRLDEAAAFGIAREIDAWVARGAPSRRAS